MSHIAAYHSVKGEKLVKSRLVVFLAAFDILNFSQFGFRESKSTSDAVSSLLDTLYTSLNAEDVAAVVFCKYFKGF